MHIHTSHFKEALIQFMRFEPVLSSLLFRFVQAPRRISYPCLNVNDNARNKFYMCLQQVPLKKDDRSAMGFVVFFCTKWSNSALT